MIVLVINYTHIQIISFTISMVGEKSLRNRPDPWLAGDASAPPRMSCAWQSSTSGVP